MKRKAYSRGERKAMILIQFYTSLGRGDSVWISAYGMAKLLEMNSAQHVRNIMNEMVLEGTLVSMETTHRPNRNKIVYAPTPIVPLATDEQVRERHISVNGMAWKFE